MAEKRVGVLFEVLDKFTKPFRGMHKSVTGMVAPFKRLGQTMGRALEVTGIKRMGASLIGLQASLGNVAKAAKLTRKHLAIFGLGGMGAVWGFNRTFIAQASDAEQLTLSLYNVAGGAEAAEREFKRLSQFAQANALDVADVTAAYKQMREAGGNASDDLLKKMGDAAAGNKKSFEEVGAAMASVMAGDVGSVSSIDPTVSARDIGDKLLFTWEENGKKMHAAVSKRNKQLMAETLATLWSKRHAGAMERYGNTWEGMLGRVTGFFKKFQSMVMDGGAFGALKEKLGTILATLEAMAENGQLEEWAERVGKGLVRLFDRLESGVKTAWKWLDRLSGAVGGWGNLAIGVFAGFVAFMGGPLLLSLLMAGKAFIGLGMALSGPFIFALSLVGKAVLALGATIMATPIGWLMAAIAVIAGLAYVLWDNWEPIKQYFVDMWEDIKAAFDDGWIKGVATILSKCNPHVIIMDGINGLIKYLTGVDLKAEGERLFLRFWEGMKEVWSSISAWFGKQLDDLTAFMPDWLKKEMGISVNASTPDARPEDMSADEQRQAARDILAYKPDPAFDSLGDRAAAAIDASGRAQVAALRDMSMHSTLTIRADLPPSMTVEGRTDQGNGKLKVDRSGLGRAM